MPTIPRSIIVAITQRLDEIVRKIVALPPGFVQRRRISDSILSASMGMCVIKVALAVLGAENCVLQPDAETFFLGSLASIWWTKRIWT
jgi:hypothetical protein